MGIFSSIKGAIFGSDEEEKTEAKPTATTGPKERAAITTEEVEQRIANIPGADGLNWKSSIVDLMKLVKIDPSYENRKELAQEMGNASYSGSAEDNIKLHADVMAAIGKAGGIVPDDMKG
ncbi:DUF3597 domain-containing protein [Erythrobacter crassostreae]|uniref:DUF3597 domain-containing protein n=1 Tax=Erythrobacter crassostreae TaxID=2828328 RepID=A0A9X1F440_9SPHN|nr:DUF3597 domain-containing protein [Erythrobacter crassostrea]MBV7259429.1 DUF3597 domain-containing protein [Erythrobacter crassostrea]